MVYALGTRRCDSHLCSPSPVAGNVDGACYVHAVRQTHPLTRAYEHGGIHGERGPVHTRRPRACLLARDVVPARRGVSRRAMDISRIVNATHHARHVPRRENVGTLRACTHSFTRGRAHGRRMNESRKT